ncbi:CPBP family intramembrane metalloprotease [Gleimia sp. 6138-11-ORH1]|uniref:CPBP family intramembrane glutamic endopeptidase n=1 Tax=Gleimia sp. 6138-11-ORH1 TaxID=2973937 RepID=UPI00216868A2|nr:type II CAAX endopeptidase family protein [Gleimia sp. 6138-11-ORH1]MCS4484553.1 CPBP family intramembrane metalloprotease [Gleimia sp. 6138-11-ORH1]
MFFPPRAISNTPVEYPLAFTGPDIRWWRVLLGLPTLILSFLLFSIIFVIGLGFFLTAEELSNILRLVESSSLDVQNPTHFIILAVSLAVLIPAVYLAYLVSFGVKPRFVTSVAGKIRWSWMMIAFLIAAGFSSFLIFGGSFLEAGGFPEYSPNPRLGLMLVLVFTLIPFQSAAEEYVFRAYIPHFIGALIPWRGVAIITGLVVSSFLFALAHGSFDPSTFTQLAAFGAIAWYVTYRTGGLEASIATHTMNNTLIFAQEMLKGESSALVTSETVTSWPSTLIVIGFGLLEASVIIWVYRKWEARKENRSHLTNPALRPPVTEKYLYNEYTKNRVYLELFSLYPINVQLKIVEQYPHLREQLPAADQPEQSN